MAFLPAICTFLLMPREAESQTGPAESNRPIAAVKTTTPPTIDGDLSDEAWKAAPRAEGFFDQQGGNQAPDQTVAYILYDDKYVYVAFHCKDSQPDKIVARETVRDHKYQSQDGSGNNEDNVEVILDPFLTRKFSDLSLFSVNPLGTPSARISGGRAGKVEWKGDWDAAAKRTVDGWTAEMRIPWQALSYPSGKKSIDIGINFTRFQDRTKIRAVWSNTGPQSFADRMGTWTGCQVPASAFKPKLSLLPYLLPSMLRSQPGVRTGLDARYTVTPELTAVSSLNPDFATIEGAVEGIQFSRTERFIPERRPFFLEGNDYFRAGEFFGFGPYFYSQRIETFDFGTKVYGKITPADTLGFLHTIDFSRRSDVVARYRHDLSPTSSAGLFFTHKSATDDNNSVGILNHNARWGKFGVDSELGASTGRDAGGGLKRINLTYQDKRTFTSLQYLDISPHFRDANGLIFFNDYRGFSVYNEWGSQWREGFWRGFGVDFYPTYTWHANGKPFQRGAGLDVVFETRSDWRFRLGTQYFHFDDQLDRTYTLVVRRGVSNRFRQWGLRMTTGQQGNRPYSFVGPEFSVRVLGKLDIAYGGAVVNLDGRAQQHVLTTSYELSPTRAIGGRVVVQDADTNWYLSFRNSGLLGTETFFILGDPNARRFTEFAAVKFVFAI
jgi:hypothetical protein